MHLENIINEIHRMATGPATSLFIFQFYLGGKVLQAELRRALAKGSFTQVLELKVFLIRPIFWPSKNISIMVRKYLLSSSEIYINDITSIGQHFPSIFKVGQNYHNFNLWRNYKDFKIWVTEKLLMIKLSIKDKFNRYLDNFNPDLAVAWERINQDYLHECQVLLTEVASLAEKLAIYLIQNDQHWCPGHINVDVSELYDECFENNLTLTKNCVLKKSLTY
jgi:hypothetical protein